MFLSEFWAKFYLLPNRFACSDKNYPSLRLRKILSLLDIGIRNLTSVIYKSKKNFSLFVFQYCSKTERNEKIYP